MKNNEEMLKKFPTMKSLDADKKAWVFGFNGKVQILAPERVKEQYRQMIAKADENMQESE